MTTINALADAVRGRAADLRGLNARVRFALGADGGILVDGTRTPAVVTVDGPADGEGKAGDADCTLRLSADNLNKLIQGKLNPMAAFALGKLKVDGSKGVAMKLAALLDA